jgi:hypothetical protein
VGAKLHVDLAADARLGTLLPGGRIRDAGEDGVWHAALEQTP